MKNNIEFASERNRRKATRYPLALEANIRFDKFDTEIMSLTSQNISTSGFFVNCDCQIPEGTKAYIELKIPLEQLKQLGDDRAVLHLTGNVVRSDTDSIAVMFKDIPEF